MSTWSWRSGAVSTTLFSAAERIHCAFFFISVFQSLGPFWKPKSARTFSLVPYWNLGTCSTRVFSKYVQLKAKEQWQTCLPPYACFSPHFHESGNEHLSLLPTFLNTHGRATFLLSSFLSRSVSSSVFHSKNVGCLNLLWSAAVAESLLKAAYGPENSLTSPDSLYFPTWSHWLPVCSQLVPHVVRIPFVLFLLDYSEQILAAFLPKLFEESPPKRQGERDLCICSWMAAPMALGVLVHKHSHACRQPAGWHRQSCIML